MKINLSVFEDEDTKDAIMYQSLCWDLQCIVMPGVEIIPFFPTPSVHYKVTQGS